jgi:predicted ATPase/DNA-binding winged helix-turn-helix (wHTH) protein
VSIEVCRFAEFEIDRSVYQLRRNGRPLKLERRPLDLLFLLIERREELVTREEILDRIWGKGVFLDVDNAINSAVRKIRRALDDDSDAPRFIETVPTRGYRFVAKIEETRPPASRGGKKIVRAAQNSMVGRERELGTLLSGLEDTALGRGGMYLISGEPGIGKSRLCEELMAGAESNGRLILVGHCHQDEGVPFLPFVEMLEKFADRAPAPETLRRELADEGSELARLLPKLRRILPDLPPPMDLSPAEARRHLFSCFCDFVVRLASQKSAMLVVEDLHWADESTLALLHFIAQRLSGARLMVVGTFRDAETDIGPDLAKTLEELLRGRRAPQLKLRGLKREEVAAMLNIMSGKSLPASLVSEIYAETDGNPFFVEELYRYLQEENRLYDTAGQVRSELKLAEVDAPPSIRLVVARRLERLSPATQKTLAMAAVIGRFFSFDLLCAASATDSDALLEYLEEAERAGLVSSAGASHRAIFQFSHELVRQAVISGLSSAKCDKLHLEIAETIERIYASTLEDYWGELAFHYNHSSNSQKAVEYLGHAATQAVRGTAYAQAVSYIRSALERLQEWPLGEARNRTEVTLQLTVGPVLQNTLGQGSPEAEKPYLRAYELCREIDDPSQLFRVMSGLWGCYQVQAKFEAARKLGVELLALAENLRRPLFLLAAHEAIGTTCMWLGELASARAHLEKALSFYDRSKRRPRSSFRATQDPGVDCLSFLSFTLWYLGYPDQALRASKEAIALAHELEHPYTLGYAAVHAGIVRRWRGEQAASIELMEEADAICSKHGFPFFLSQAIFFRGWFLIQQGDHEKGLAQMLQGIEAYRATNSGINWPQHFIPLADVYESTGRIVEGLEVIDEAIAVVERTGERRDEPEAHRFKGVLTLHSKTSQARSQAEEHFRKAIEVARAQEARSWELRATTSLARLLRDTNRRDEARTMLAEIYNWFTEGFDTADLKDAKALLDELQT